MNTVDGIGRYINRTMESKRKITALEIVVYGLRKRNDIESFLPQQICRLLAAVAA